MQTISRKCAANSLARPRIGVLAALIASIGACGAPEKPADETQRAEAVTYRCGETGFLSTSLYGAFEGTLRWDAADLECAGMPRPGGEGARLRFAGEEDGRRIAFIIAVPGLERGATGSELQSNVTLIEEGSGRFFSTANLDNCWTDITYLNPLADTEERFTIGGTLYCVSPLAEINGDSSVSITELEFEGLLDWNAS